MTDEQYRHILHISAQFTNLMEKKYEIGQKEHGGNLWENSELKLCEFALEEAIDMVVYLITLRDRLVKNYGIGHRREEK